MTVIMMVRNEADILARVLAHASTLFDRAIVIDHRSTDGSGEILKAARAEWPALEIFNYGVQGYFQEALSTAFARQAFEEGADWVFFLDADEFVNVPDRAALLGVLPVNDTIVCSFLWRNLAPTVFGTYQDFNFQQEFLVSQTKSRYGKIVLSRRILQEAPDFRVALGNHTVSSARHAGVLEAPIVGEFLHIPIRSRDRLAMKVEAGVAAYRAKTNKQTAEGSHWFELLERVRDGTADDDFLRAVALNYGEPLASVAALSSYSICRQRIESAGFAGASPLPRNGNSGLARGRAETESLDQALAWRRLLADGEAVAVLVGENNEITLSPQVMRSSGGPRPGTFGSLAPEDAAFDLSEQQLVTAVRMAFTPIETLVPSAWSYLVPVMFGLIALLRPRRFVELGSHYGCSFFAACQALRALEISADAVAIDTWKGDLQAGHYPESVFEDFIHILRTRYPDRSHYIRSKFDDAVSCFEDGSIDLLHIDGLHHYDAVRADFEAWLPKMSDRGVIIMHDTTVYDAGYEVWLLWRDIAARYPAVNLLHCHGLGVAYVGTRQGRFVEIMRELGDDPTRLLLLNAFAGNLGDLAISAATSGQKAEAAVHGTAALRAELTATHAARDAELEAAKAAREVKLAAAEFKLATAEAALELKLAELHATRSELEVVRPELEAVRSELEATRTGLARILASTSWRVSAPLRILGRMLRGHA
jgi:glycosyltransferase involved in cell wall biosynthesis